MWQETNNELYKKFVFKDFAEAFDFMTRVAALAERDNHHPRWQNVWNTVEIWLSTHDKSNTVTEKDRVMATEIDKLFQPDAKSQSTPSENIIVKVFADGGSRGNPGPSASGYAVLTPEDKIIFKEGVYIGITTNNQAEYKALKFALEKAYELGAQEVSVFMDSQLVINQMKGVYKVKNKDLFPIHSAIKTQAGKFRAITYTHVPRELNKLADSMVNEALDAQA